MSDYNKPLPAADPMTAPYWESLKAHAAQIQYSPQAGKYVFYPREVCPYTGSRELEWRPVSGRGVIHAFCIPHRHPNRAFLDNGPYVVALIELEEGVRVMSTLVDVTADPQHVKIGTPVEIVYDNVTAEVTLPRFRPRQ